MNSKSVHMLLIASALAAGACSRKDEVPRQSSVTVKLPPPRPHPPEPGFSLASEAPQRT